MNTPAPMAPRRTIALCATLQAVGGGLGWSLLPPLMPQIARDLHISHAMGGLVWGAAPLGIALASPLGGAAVDRLGARWTAGLAMLVGALACAARALANDPWTMALAMLAFGLHIGFVAPAIPKALAGHVPGPRLGRASGIALVGYTLGTALTVLTARLYIAPALGGWRPTMVAAACAMAVAGLLWLGLMRDRVLPSRHAGLGDVFALAKNRALMRVACMHFLLFGGYLALLGMLPRALFDAGVPPRSIGIAVAGWLCAAGFANFAGPWLSDRLGRRRPILLAGALVAGGALALLAVVPREHALIPLVIAALGGGSLAPLLLTLPLELPGVGAPRVGAALGLLMLVGQIGGFLLPLAAGWLAGAQGAAAALAMLALAHLAIVVPAAGLHETGRAARPAATPAASRLVA